MCSNSIRGNFDSQLYMTASYLLSSNIGYNNEMDNSHVMLHTCIFMYLSVRNVHDIYRSMHNSAC